MKIAIIGGGWVGCHLAHKLRTKHKVTLFEKNEELFDETSYRNQNRLHYGFHYARNFKTRELCNNTFSKFMEEYAFLTKEVKNNLYCVPNNKSIIDYETYKEIFKNFNLEEIKTSFKDIEGCINTNERYIDFDLAKKFFNETLSDIFVREKIDKGKLKKISKNYDLVINATNNEIKDKHNKNSFFESTVSLLYRKINETEFDALTMVDGMFFSIYPYQNDVYTVTDVEHTPIKKLKTLDHTKYSIDKSLLEKKKKLIEDKIKHYYPDFSNDFIYNGYFISIKSKIISTSDERYPVITFSGNVLNCFTGKIQGIYIIENTINKILKNSE